MQESVCGWEAAGTGPYSPRSSPSKLAVPYFTPRIECVVVALCGER